MKESETEVVCTCEKTRPRIHQKTNISDGRRGRPKQRWVDCVNQDMRSIGTTEDEVHDRTGSQGCYVFSLDFCGEL